MAGEQTAAGRLVDEEQPAVDASTILLLHDPPATSGPGLEVLLLERHIESDFAGGALVFPGGKVDATDRALPPERYSGRDPAAWRSALGADTDEQALGLLVAAVRETFEEADVLLATRAGAPVTDEDLASPSFVEARRRLSSRDEDFDWTSWLAEEDLVLDLGALALWAWWVTPKGQHKRFDTRFFVARLPAEQSAAHDDIEMTSLRWTTPQAALEAQRAGEMTVIYPTRKNLEALAAHASAKPPGRRRSAARWISGASSPRWWSSTAR
jgi:8-oxo-dGTP pyrophosphatase MutT (NUDIX family)